MENDDLKDYALFLGFEIEEEPELAWIAEEGLNADLPPGWQLEVNGDEDVFYFNTKTGKSTWEHPSDSHYKELVVTERERLRKIKKSRREVLSPSDGLPEMNETDRSSRCLGESGASMIGEGILALGSVKKDEDNIDIRNSGISSEENPTPKATIFSRVHESSETPDLGATREIPVANSLVEIQSGSNDVLERKVVVVPDFQPRSQGGFGEKVVDAPPLVVSVEGRRGTLHKSPTTFSSLEEISPIPQPHLLHQNAEVLSFPLSPSTLLDSKVSLSVLEKEISIRLSIIEQGERMITRHASALRRRKENVEQWKGSVLRAPVDVEARIQALNDLIKLFNWETIRIVACADVLAVLKKSLLEMALDLSIDKAKMLPGLQRKLDPVMDYLSIGLTEIVQHPDESDSSAA